MALIRQSLFVGAVLASLAATARSEDIVTVSYAGTALRERLSGQPLSSAVDVTIAFKASAFTAANGHYTGAPSLSDLVSWSLSVGAFTLNSSSGTLSFSSLGAPILPFIQVSDGHVTDWSLAFSGVSGGLSGGVTLLSRPGAGLNFYDEVTEGGSFPPVLWAMAYQPGTWSVPSAVPEPGTDALFMSGLVLGALCLRRRASPEQEAARRLDDIAVG